MERTPAAEAAPCTPPASAIRLRFRSRSPEQLVQENRELLADVPTVHHGHTSEISITGSDSATGIWAMYDRVELPGNCFEGYGHYHEEYRRDPDGWKIRRMRITRLKIAPLAP